MQYQAALPDRDFDASTSVYVAESLFSVWERRTCKGKGHPLTINDGYAGPEGAKESVHCLCGAQGFSHVYF